MHIEPVTCAVVTLCPRTGRILASRKHHRTRVAFCLDDDDRKVLVVGADAKTAQEFAVAGGVRVHTKFVSAGKATLTIVRRNIQIMLSEADPSDLTRWCTSLTSGAPPPKKDSLPLGGAPTIFSLPPKRHLGPSSPAGANIARQTGAAGSPPNVAKMSRPPDASPPSRPQQLSPNALSTLTSEQQEVLRQVVLEGRSVFFTGGAGVGKSFLLKQLVGRLDPTRTFVTASTGIAACGVGGVTIHHWAGIGGGGLDRPFAEVAASAARKRGAQWRAAKTLFIDEISMLDGDVFDLLERLARHIRGNSRPFGGLQLVLSGDFFQLPPVAKGAASFKYAFEAASWDACIHRTFELTRVFRQSDPEFVDALNAIRLGHAPPEVRRLLSRSERRTLPSSDGIVATRLFTHKAECAKLNDTQLRALPGEQFTFTARDTSRDESALATLRAACPAPDALTLRVGAQVILLKTLDVDAGLVNGCRGVVTKFLATRNPSVRFDNGVERVLRYESFALSQGGQTVACRMALPIALGWAISVHKSQGMTLDRVEMSLRNVFECGQMYVALSRVRALEGLSLRDIDWSKCRANPKVLAWHRAMMGAAAASGSGSGAAQGAQRPRGEMPADDGVRGGGELPALS